MTLIIAVVGAKHSGKTTTIEALTRELTRRGHDVAAVKHVSEADFTIDTKGKDTWRYGKAGARTVVSIAAKEIATIEKSATVNISVLDIVKRLKDCSVVLTEGFKKNVSREKSIPKIVAVKSLEEACDAVKAFSPILAFTGPCSTQKLGLDVPYVDVVRDASKLADLTEKIMKK